MNKAATEYMNRLRWSECRKLAEIALERLIETEEVRFREDDATEDPEDVIDECFYWVGSGDNLLETK